MSFDNLPFDSLQDIKDKTNYLEHIILSTTALHAFCLSSSFATLLNCKKYELESKNEEYKQFLNCKQYANDYVEESKFKDSSRLDLAYKIASTHCVNYYNNFLQCSMHNEGLHGRCVAQYNALSQCVIPFLNNSKIISEKEYLNPKSKSNSNLKKVENEHKLEKQEDLEKIVPEKIEQIERVTQIEKE